MRKIQIIFLMPLLLCLAFTTVQAGGLEDQPEPLLVDYYSVPYVLFGVNVLARGDIQKSKGSGSGTVFFEGPVSGDSVGLDIAAGYMRLYNKVVLAGNLTFRYFPGVSNGVNLPGIDTPRVSSYVMLGLDFKPGILIGPCTILSAILGLETADYKVRYQFNATRAVFSGWQMGPGFGLSLSTELTPRLILAFSYLYVLYSHLRFADKPGQADVSLLPAMNIISLDLSFWFSS